MNASANQQEAIISVRGLVNRFCEQIVHDGLDFDILKGDIVGVIGGSGSGKSVLMRSITGLQHPASGTVIINGRKLDYDDIGRTSELFGILFQHGALFSGLSVLENVMAPLRERTNLSEDLCRQIARVKIALANLPPDAADKKPSQLSGGMIKRAALARALALDPPILFLDEPTAGLDPIGASAFDELIRSLRHNLNITIIIITHDLDTLFTVCDKAAALVDKRIVIDTLPNLMEYNHPWLREYFHGTRARSALGSNSNSLS